MLRLQVAALREEAAQAASVAAAAAASALAELRRQCERTVTDLRQQAAARLEDSDSRHGAKLAQAEQEAARKIELLQAAHLEAVAAARQDAADQQARCLLTYQPCGSVKHRIASLEHVQRSSSAQKFQSLFLVDSVNTETAKKCDKCAAPGAGRVGSSSA